MKNIILGIGAFGHDASACIVDKTNGEVLFAISEERLSNIKHDWHFPVGSIKKCCEYAKSHNGLISDIAVNFDESEFINGTLCRRIETITGKTIETKNIINIINKLLPIGDYYSTEGYSFSRDVINSELRCNYDQMKEIEKAMSWYYNWAIKYRNILRVIQNMFPNTDLYKINHHLSHAASAFYNSGFEKATVISIDGQGESETTAVYIGDNKGLTKVSKSVWPNSLGIFYLFATEHLGFGFGDEYKVMGMSAYGSPRFYDILSKMIKVTDLAEMEFIETDFFNQQYLPSTGHLVMRFNEKFKEIVPTRDKSAKIEQVHYDFAASIQKLTEEVGVQIIKKAIAMTGIDKVAIAGGVGLNGLMNEKIRKNAGVSDIFIYPAAGDDGTAVGAAQYLAFSNNPLLSRKRINTCYYGSSFSNDEIIQILEKLNINYSKPVKIQEQIADALARGKIVARYNGRSEFGPRALGNRSILANPHDPEMKNILNKRIKHREEFRPFAPACLKEEVHNYFEFDIDSPFMLLICQAKDIAKKKIPAIVHNDGTARVQTITRDQNADFYEIIKEFYKITDIPVVINTSFNVNGEAIVDTPLDAIESFGFMDIDYLAIGDFWIDKNENISKFPRLSHEEYLNLRKKRFLSENSEIESRLDISKFNKCFFLDE